MRYYIVHLETGDKWGAFPSVGVAKRKAELHGLHNIAIVDEKDRLILGYRYGQEIKPIR